MEPRDQNGDRPADGARGEGRPAGASGPAGDSGFARRAGAGPEPWRAPPTAAELRLCPWERREAYGFLNALYLTTREILSGPGKFFRRMPSRVGLTQPLLYAVVLGVVAAFLGWMWSLAGSSLQVLLSRSAGHAINGPLWTFLAFVASPVAVVAAVFVRAALMHLGLRLLGGNQLGFEATFRVAAYGQAAGILMLVPLGGGFLAVTGELVIDIIGLHSIHGTDPWRAIVAVLAPALLGTAAVGVLLAAALIALGLS